MQPLDVIVGLAGDPALELLKSRNFARVFTREVGQTPARYIDTIRVDAAQRRLEESTDSLDEIATQCGFGSANSTRRSLLRTRDVAPLAYRQRCSHNG